MLKGIAYDGAVLAASGAGAVTLVTTDTLVEGVHFDLAWHPPALLGRKAVAVNISDIAAMGGIPRFALLSLAAPAAAGLDLLEPFMQGFLAELARYQVTLIGGDTVKSDQGLILSVTMIGEAAGAQVLYRSGARPGDQIWVSGYLGEAAAGLEVCRQGQAGEQQAWAELVEAHLAPRPEVAMGRALAASGLASAMVDMSDGLASDLAHICQESGVGATVSALALPISAACRQAAHALGVDPLTLAIAGGEDYRLLFTAPRAASQEVRALAPHAVGGQLFMVGAITEGHGVVLASEGQETPIDFQGYDHFGGRQ